MSKIISHTCPFILISTSSDFRDESATPSPLAKHYHLSSMVSIFQKKFWPKLSKASTEELIQKMETIFNSEDNSLETDMEEIAKVMVVHTDIDEKVKKLITLHSKVHYRSENRILILIAKLVFANEQWFIDFKAEAQQVFPNQEFNPKFFDLRRNLVCLLARKK